MKLKTKFQDEDFELGEVVEADIFYGGPESSLKVETRAANGGCHTFYCDSLKQLNDLFEDYQGPKEYWYIYGGQVLKNECDGVIESGFKEVGNYFETEEEAELAVRKLKAFKRLKDNGMIKHSFRKEKTGITSLDLDFYTLTILAPKDKDSLDLLFGGEE